MAIGKKVSSSLRWMAGLRIIGQLITWASTLLVYRILSPEDYGIMAIAMLVIGFLVVINEMGLASAIIQKKDLARKTVQQVFGVLILFNAMLYGLLYLSAPYIAEFFSDERLTFIIHVLGIQILITIFFIIPDSIMTRNMDFRRISIIHFFSVITQSLSTLAFAYYGAGVWSLVYGTLIAAMVKTIGTILIAQYFCMPIFSFKNIGSVLSFGGFVTVHRILYYFFAQADVFIIGKLLGKVPLGYFSLAMQLASMPMEKFQGVLNEVGFSAFSQIQENKTQVIDHLRKAIRILGVVVFPVFMGISCIAPELIDVLVGEKWQPAALPLQILSIVMALKMMNITDPVLFALGRPEVGVKILAIGCVIMPIAFLIGARWGLLGVSLAWLIAYPLQFFITLKIALPVIGIKMGQYIGEFIYPALVSGLMYIAVLVAKATVSPTINQPIVELLVLISIGAITYGTIMLLTRRSSLLELYAMVRH